MVGDWRANSLLRSHRPRDEASISSTHHARIIGSSSSIAAAEQRREELAILGVLGRIELFRDHAADGIGLRRIDQLRSSVHVHDRTTREDSGARNVTHVGVSHQRPNVPVRCRLGRDEARFLPQPVPSRPRRHDQLRIVGVGPPGAIERRMCPVLLRSPFPLTPERPAPGSLAHCAKVCNAGCPLLAGVRIGSSCGGPREGRRASSRPAARSAGDPFSVSERVYTYQITAAKATESTPTFSSSSSPNANRRRTTSSSSVLKVLMARLSDWMSSGARRTIPLQSTSASSSRRAVRCRERSRFSTSRNHTRGTRRETLCLQQGERAMPCTCAATPRSGTAVSTSRGFRKYRKNVRVEIPAAVAIWSTVTSSRPRLLRSSRPARSIPRETWIRLPVPRRRWAAGHPVP